MAKEQVNIVFSADSAQARQLFQEMANGLDKVGRKTVETSKGFEGLGGTLSTLATRAGLAGVAMATLHNMAAQGADKSNRAADAYNRQADAMARIRLEGSLTPEATKMVAGAIARATQSTAVDVPTAQGVAQQMLEDKFSAGDIAGGGLEAMLQGIVAVNARGEGGDPKQLARGIANAMQALGRAPTTAGIEATTADLHGLLNATGLDINGAQDLIMSMSRSNKPKIAKVLASRGLKPGDIDPNLHGIGGAGQRLAQALDGMEDSDAAAFLSRVLGDSGATAFMRGREEFASGKVSSSAAAVARDFQMGSTGWSADQRRRASGYELKQADRGELDAKYQMYNEQIRQRNEERGFSGRLINAVDPIFSWGAELIGGDAWRKSVVDAQEAMQRSIKVEITTPNGGRMDGRVRGTQHLAPLSN